MLTPMQRIAELKSKGLLTIIFEAGLNDGGTPSHYFFDSVYAPIRLPTASGMPATWTYAPIGWSYSEIAEIYGDMFRGNFWPQYFKDAAALNDAISNYASEAVSVMQSVLRYNMYKYQRLIELQGYTWNPMWNVDGEELHATIEQHAEEKESTATDYTSTTSRKPYDSTTWQDAEKRTDSGTAANNTRTRTHTQDAHAISADDNAFGEALSGGDTYHAEKTIRRGNIGVTQTTQLIENARRALDYSVLRPFFEDLNKQLLIGIF